MKKELLQELRQLLAAERVLSLGVLRDGNPYVGLLPYVIARDFSCAFVHASRLALHSAGLVEGARFSVMIHGPVSSDSDPLQIQRVTLDGSIGQIARDSRDYVVVRGMYIERFPTSARTFELGDFSLYRLRFDGGRYVGGFARARSLGPNDIEALGTGLEEGPQPERES
jgi:putative heme iron utilization protein